MKTRFEGEDGKRRLTSILNTHRIVSCDSELAEELVRVGSVLEFKSGEDLIEQGGADNDLFFILEGEVAVFVNSRPVAKRGPRETIGEMALLDPSARRSAAVTAQVPTTALCVAEADFISITKSNAVVWRELAIVVAERLRERNLFHRAPNQRPKLFLGSSVESLPVAEAIRLGLKHAPIDVRLWSDPGLFSPGGTTAATLIAAADESDFAAFVFGTDDKVVSRDEEFSAPRDNVVFELGLFIGRLGADRSFVIREQAKDIKIPTDLLGVTSIEYVARAGKELREELATAWLELKQVIERVGVR